MIKNKLHLFVLILSLLLCTIYCGKNKENVSYKELKFENIETDFVDVDIPQVYHIAKTKKNIIISTDREIWKIDLDTKKSQKLFNHGIGPDQIYYPFRVINYNNDIYVNSMLLYNCFYKFSPDSEKIDLKQIRFNNALTFNDFEFLSNDLIIAVHVNWEDGYIRLYNLNNWEYQKIKGECFHPFMLHFNVNIASLCVLDNNVYVAQSIKSEIQVVSLKERKTVGFIKLMPPFYKPMPGKYEDERYDTKKHKAWMASWSSVFDIFGKNNWLLVIYKWGYDKRYCYELINLKNPDERFYINETDKRIYEFNIENKKISFECFTELEEKIVWQKASASLY